MKQLDKTAISKLIPHGLSMSLLDSVERWNSSVIECNTISHRDPNNPLREGEGFDCILLAEYAAQAAAVHASLQNTQLGAEGRPAVVGAIKSMKLFHNDVSALQGSDYYRKTSMDR